MPEGNWVMGAKAAFDLNETGRAPVLALSGDWTVDTIAVLEADLRALAGRLIAGSAVDVGRLGRLDVAGAYLIDRTFRESGATSAIAVRGEHANALALLAAARKSAAAPALAPNRPRMLEQIGRAMGAIGEEIIETVSFMGACLAVLGRLCLRPQRLRWVSVVHVMELAGFNALPIVALLAFFIGLVRTMANPGVLLFWIFLALYPTRENTRFFDVYRQHFPELMVTFNEIIAE